MVMELATPSKIVGSMKNPPLSTRAAFGAHTRSGWRAVGQPDTGTLAPGAPAHLAVWAVDDIVELLKHADMAECGKILAGGLLIGGAAELAGYLLG